VICEKIGIDRGVSVAIDTSNYEGDDCGYVEINPKIVEEVIVGHPVNIHFHHNYNYV
jgi:hypothetical protein